MAVFTTTVTINQAKLPNNTPIGLTAGRAEITSGTPFGAVGRDVVVTAFPATGYEFVNFIVEEQDRALSSVNVGVNTNTQEEVCLPANNFGVSRKLYFTVNPTTSNREPGVALDEDGNQEAPDGFYAAGNNQYYKLQGAVLNGPFTCGTTAGPGVASDVILYPTAMSIKGTGVFRTFTITIKDATGKTLVGKPVVWTSTNSDIASVDQTGKVTSGETAGSTTIRASVKNVTGLQTEAYADAVVNVSLFE